VHACVQAAIRRELNDFKSAEMEVHEESRHMTRLVSLYYLSATFSIGATDGIPVGIGMTDAYSFRLLEY